MAAPSPVISSRQFQRGGFAPHGEFRVHYEQGLLMWENRGPFNREALQCYGRARSEAYARWQLDEHWVAAVVDWQGSALMPPDAFEAYRAGFERFMAGHHSLVAVAWVQHPGCEGLDFMVERFAPLFERYGLPLRVFDALEPAADWARQQLARRAGAPAPAEAVRSD